MKKSLLFAGAIFLTSGIAIAKTIDFDTSIKWNSNVVELALNKSGFLGSYDAYQDVRVTHERILAELLKMESFSVRDATRVCLDKCNMSDFLKNGRGESGKKCPELCSGFADTLVSVNNEYTKTGAIALDNSGLNIRQNDGTHKVFSSDKQFYALVDSNTSSWNLTEKYKNTCNYTNYTRVQAVIFDNTTKQPCALLCENATGNAPLFLDCATKKCEKMEFLLPISETTYFDGSQDKVNKIKELLYFSESVSKENYKESLPANKQETNQTAYGNKVQRNGYCDESVSGFLNGTDISNISKLCKTSARKFAQQHACKLKNYGYIGGRDVSTFYGDCIVNTWDFDTEPNKKQKSLIEKGREESFAPCYDIIHYDYTPTYQECIATFNEQTCNSTAK